jgi:hypothetical protein
MSVKQRGRSLGQKIKLGSETAGRDVKKGMARVARGARRVGRDVEGEGRKAGKATRRGMTRADDRIRPSHRSKSRS